MAQLPTYRPMEEFNINRFFLHLVFSTVRKEYFRELAILIERPPAVIRGEGRVRKNPQPYRKS